MASLNLDHYTCAGYALELLAQSEYHKQYAMGQYLRAEILPALWHKQARFYVSEEGMPTALVTWAWLSKEVEQDLHTTGRALTDEEWHSGDRLFFNDWITPYGNIREAMKDMTHNIFPNHTATSIRRKQDGSVNKINRWTGINLRNNRNQNSNDSLAGVQR